MENIDEVKTLPELPPRPSDAHKGTFGQVLIVAGSRGMVGAAALCAQAALRGGAGLVHVAVPEEVYPIVAAQVPCAIYHPMPQTDSGTLSAESVEEIETLVADQDVVVLGPGITTHEETKSVALQLISNIEQKMVIDADGINAVAAGPDCLREGGGERILTPHPGEMSRLTGTGIKEIQQDRVRSAAEFASKYGVCLALKGKDTVVTDGSSVYVNKTGNQGMATAGSGDVLTGLIAGLWGQGMSAFKAAQLGAHLHGLAGDIAEEALTGHCMTASDILNCLAKAFKKHLEH